MRDQAPAFDAAAIEAEEDFVIDAQFLIQELLNEHGMTRAELARKVGISKARLTQLLRPDANPTLRTVARVLHALGEKASLKRCLKEAASQAEATSVWAADLQGHGSRQDVGYDSVLAFRSLYDRRDRFVENRRAELFDVVEAANDCLADEELGVAA